MLVECYDEKGAEVYEIIIKQIFQDLVLGSSVDDLKAFVNPDDPVFILAIKMKKTSSMVQFKDVASFNYDKADDVTRILVEDENYLPNLQRRIYDAIFRILPEGFKIIKDMSTKDIVAVVATDELIYDAWIEKANEYIAELDNGM